MQQSITDRVKSYEDACGILGIAPLTLDQFSFLPESQQKSSIAYQKLQTIAEVLREGVEFDWNDTNQKKWFPYFDFETYDDNPPGSGFAFRLVDCRYVYSDVGSRLCFTSSEKAKYAAEQFLDIYKDFMR